MKQIWCLGIIYYIPKFEIMKPANENQAKRNTDPSNVSKNPSHKSIKKVEDSETTSYVDLDKANFADRKHGRTNDSLGPDHEPGTV